jgi:basic amino acid/polyamine antiporter, APA family
MSSPSQPSLVRGLGLIAATAIVVGDVVGTGVFLKARVMTCNVGTPGLVMGAWVVAGLLSLAGALTYAELAAMMPHAGGEYVYVRDAYGRLWAFLFGWMRFFIGSTGGNAALAAGLAIFLNVLMGGVLDRHVATVSVFGMFDWQVGAVQAVAVASLVIATAINCATISVGGDIAAILTALKVSLIVGLGIAILAFAAGDWGHFALSGAAGACEGIPASARGGVAGFGAAMMAALWAYNGWNEMTYVAGEVRSPERNLPLALIGGIGLIGLIYVFINTTYFYILAPVDVANVSLASSVATEAVAQLLGPAAEKVMAAALVVSIFSAMQVAVLVCARVPFAMAEDGLFFKSLGRVSPRTRVPITSLVAQAAWSIVLVLSGSFDALTDYAVFAILIFSALITGAIFVLRRRLPDAVRPYRTWGYPVVPVLFLVVTAWLVVNTIVTTPRQSLAGLGLIALGLPFYWFWSRTLPDRKPG